MAELRPSTNWFAPKNHCRGGYCMCWGAFEMCPVVSFMPTHHDLHISINLKCLPHYCFWNMTPERKHFSLHDRDRTHTLSPHQTPTLEQTWCRAVRPHTYTHTHDHVWAGRTGTRNCEQDYITCERAAQDSVMARSNNML